MTGIIKPRHLRKGDKVGIVSPSSAIKNFPQRLDRGIKALEDLGLKVVLGRNAKNLQGYNAGTAEERADDINDFFKDNEIKAIICSTGGETANSVLPFLDFELIKNNPKIFCGFSDVTTLNLAINRITGLITFNGPTVLPTFGEFGGVNSFTLEHFRKAVFVNTPIGFLNNPAEYTEEILWWDKEDNRRRQMKPASPYEFITPGCATGKIIGGNFIILCTLIGTKYFPELEDAILFLEDEGETTSSVERRLTQLEQVGVFNHIKGLIFGRPFNFKESDDRTLKDILTEFGSKYDLPVVFNLDCGHTSPMITLPIGVRAEMDSNKNTINILESATI